MQKYLKIGILILLLGAIIWARQSGVFTEDSVRGLIDSSPVLAPILFVAIYVLTTVFFLPATPLSLIGGAIFGAWQGSFYILVGATLGALISFVLARFVFRNWVVTHLLHRFPQVKAYDERLQENGLATVIFLRLIPLFPFNGLNFLLGITKVRLWEYVIATAVGIIPGVVVLSFLGGALVSRDPWAIALAVVLYGGLASIGILYNKFKKLS